MRRASLHKLILTYDLIVMGHEAWKETHLVTPPIKFKRSGIAPLTQLTTWDKEEGHDPDPECNTSHTVVATTTAHNTLQPPTRTHHTSPKIHATSALPLRSKAKSKYHPSIERSNKTLVKQLERLIIFDVPFQKAKTSPRLAVDCAVCKQFPATRTFPTDDDIATPFCASCRSAFERKATYGQFTRNSPKCSLCGSHQHRNNRQAPTPHDPSNIKGWYKKSSTGQLHCVPCAVSLRRQGRNPPFPPTDFIPPQVPTTIRHFRCLINDGSCTPSYNTKGPTSGGRFLHHYLCPKHGPNSGVNANTLTTARAWAYITQYHPTDQERQVSRIVTFVTHCINSGIPLTARTLAILAQYAVASHAPDMPNLGTSTSPPSPSFPMWLLT